MPKRHTRPLDLDDLQRRAALHHAAGGRPHFGGGPIFGGGRGRARRGDVRAALLLLLAEEPRNGYQLMQAIEERSGGRWRPSPGSVYPTLAQLEDQGFVRSRESEGGRVFQITEEGREHIESSDHDTVWPADEGLTDLKPQLKQISIAAGLVLRAGSEAQIEAATAVLAEARRKLYRILAEDDPEDGPESAAT